MSLREKIISEQTQKEAEAASLREKLEAERLERERNVRIQQLRAKITLREEQKKALGKAILAIEAGYTAGAANIESYKKWKVDVEASEEALKKSDEVIEQLQRDFPGVFAAKGIKSKWELLGAVDYQEQKEIKDYKGAQTAVSVATEGKKAARGSLRTGVGTLRASKKEVTEAAPDLELSFASFSKGNRADSLRRLHEYSETINQELETLKLQTPEGQKAAKEKFSAEFGKRVKDKKFFTSASLGYSVGLVKPEDVVDAEKYGEPMVQGNLREQVVAKLKTEVDKEKETAGIPEARQELEVLKQLPKRYEGFVIRVEALKQKREAVISELRGKEEVLGGIIRLYFSRDVEYEFGKLLEKDFARAWLLHTEKDFMFKQFYPTQSSWSRNEHVAEGGVPAVLGDFLENRKEAVRMVAEQGRFGDRGSSLQRSERARELFDPNLFEQSIAGYEAFLIEYEDIVRNHPEIIAVGHRSKSDRDVLHEKLGYNTSDKAPFQPLAIKSRMVGEGFRTGKSFADVEGGIKQTETPFDEATTERAEFLSRLIDKEWTEQELKVFEKTHPKARGIQERAELLEAQKRASLEFAAPLEKTRKLLSSAEVVPGDADERFKLNLKKHEQRPVRFSIMVIDSSHKSLQENWSSALQKLNEVQAKVAENKRTKRPFVSFGKSKLDKELEELKAKEKTLSKASTTADERVNAAEKLQEAIYQSLFPITKSLETGNFDVASQTFSVPGFLDRIQKIADDSSFASLSAEESQILEAYSRFQQNALEKKKELARARGDISDGVVGKLRESGWKESR